MQYNMHLIVKDNFLEFLIRVGGHDSPGVLCIQWRKENV